MEVWSLVGLLHAKFSMLPTSVKTSILLRDTLVAWKQMQKKFRLSHEVSRLMPLWSHVEFPAGRDSKLFDVWKRSGLATAGQLFHDTENRYKLLKSQKNLDYLSPTACNICKLNPLA